MSDDQCGLPLLRAQCDDPTTDMAIGSNNNVRGMCPLLLGVASSNVLCAAQMGFDLYQSLQTDFWRMRWLAELLARTKL